MGDYGINIYSNYSKTFEILRKGSQFYIGDYLPLLDNPIYHKNRLEFINWLMEILGFYYISGSLDAVCRYINKGLS